MSDVDLSQHAVEMARLRRNLGWSRFWFRFWIGTLIAAPIAFGISTLVPRSLPSALAFVMAALALITFLGPIVGIAGLVLMWSDRHRYAVSLRRAELADRLGWKYLEKADPRDFPVLREFLIYRNPTSEKLTRCMSGVIDGKEAFAADYHWMQNDWGANRATYWTVIVLEEGAIGSADLTVMPRTTSFNVHVALGALKTPLPFDGPFGDRFAVHSEFAEEARHLFGEPLQRQFLSKPYAFVEVFDGDMLVFIDKKVLEAAGTILDADGVRDLPDWAGKTAPMLRSPIPATPNP
jgi:hypothetical protein